MPVARSTIRYAAKQAYQLALMVGRYESRQCGMYCEVRPCEGFVRVYNVWPKGESNPRNVDVPIAKAWANL